MKTIRNYLASSYQRHPRKPAALDLVLLALLAIPSFAPAKFVERELVHFQAGLLDEGHIPIQKLNFGMYGGISSFITTPDGNAYIYDSGQAKALEIDPKTLATKIVYAKTFSAQEKKRSRFRVDEETGDFYFVSGNMEKIEVQSASGGAGKTVRVADPEKLKRMGTDRWRIRGGVLHGGDDHVDFRKKPRKEVESLEKEKDAKLLDLYFVVNKVDKQTSLMNIAAKNHCGKINLGTKDLYRVAGSYLPTDGGKAYFCRVLNLNIAFDNEAREKDYVFLYFNPQECVADLLNANVDRTGFEARIFKPGARGTMLELTFGSAGGKLVEWKRE